MFLNGLLNYPERITNIIPSPWRINTIGYYNAMKQMPQMDIHSVYVLLSFIFCLNGTHISWISIEDIYRWWWWFYLFKFRVINSNMFLFFFCFLFRSGYFGFYFMPFGLFYYEQSFCSSHFRLCLLYLNVISLRYSPPFIFKLVQLVIAQWRKNFPLNVQTKACPWLSCSKGILNDFIIYEEM